MKKKSRYSCPQVDIRKGQHYISHLLLCDINMHCMTYLHVSVLEIMKSILKQCVLQVQLVSLSFLPVQHVKKLLAASMMWFASRFGCKFPW